MILRAVLAGVGAVYDALVPPRVLDRIEAAQSMFPQYSRAPAAVTGAAGGTEVVVDETTTTAPPAGANDEYPHPSPPWRAGGWCFTHRDFIELCPKGCDAARRQTAVLRASAVAPRPAVSDPEAGDPPASGVEPTFDERLTVVTEHTTPDVAEVIVSDLRGTYRITRAAGGDQ